MKNPFVLLWVATPLIAIFLFVDKNGLEAIAAPAGGLLLFCGFCWILLVFRGWGGVFAKLAPVIGLLLLSGLVFVGLKAGYCGTVGSGSEQCRGR